LDNFNEIVEEVMSKNDIVDVISGYVQLQRKGSSYFGLCPFHNEKSPSFSVSRNKQMYYCFGCGAGGNVYTFLMEYEKYTFREALNVLAERAGVELPEMEYSAAAKKENDLKNTLLEINKKAATYYYYQLKGEGGENARRYFEKRKLLPETIQKFGLGYSSMYRDDLYRYMKKEGYSDEILAKSGLFSMNERGVTDKFWNRVMFPIMNVNNKVIGFGGRVMGEGEPKYLNSPETVLFDKSRNLYGLNLARSSRAKNLIICEGYMDVIAMHQAGFGQAVASLGTALTQGHAALLKRYADEVLICYDSDGAGQKAALRAIPILKRAGLRTKVINMKPYKDPDEFIKNLGAEEFQKRIDTAQNSFLYEIEILKASHDMQDPESKTDFINQTAQKLSQFDEELERNTYIQAVSDQYHLDYESLRRLVIRYGEQNQIKNVEKEQQDEDKKARTVSVSKKEDAVKMAQRIILTWLIEDRRVYPVIKKYISPADFIDPLYHEVAQKLFLQLEEGSVNPAAIMNTFEEEEEHRIVAALFNTSLSAELSDSEKERALNETVHQIKKNSVDYRSKNAASADELKALIREQAELNKLAGVHISLK
jgi:DNA primase